MKILLVAYFSSLQAPVKRGLLLVQRDLQVLEPLSFNGIINLTKEHIGQSLELRMPHINGPRVAQGFGMGSGLAQTMNRRDAPIKFLFWSQSLTPVQECW